MSAGPDFTVLGVGFVGFVGTMALSLGGAAWALRGERRRADWAASLGWSTAALGGAALMVVEVGIRVALSSMGVEVRIQPFHASAALYALWSMLVSPGLLLAAFSRRSRQTPPRIVALQVVQLAAWLLSCGATLIVAVFAGV